MMIETKVVKESDLFISNEMQRDNSSIHWCLVQLPNGRLSIFWTVEGDTSIARRQALFVKPSDHAVFR